MKDKIDRFLDYNKNRILTAEHFNKNKADFLFKIIPFLLHVNYPDLPGYVSSKDCRFGIHLFKQDKLIDPDMFRRYFPTTTALNKSTASPFTESPCIHSLKTIGSIGTIAQNEKSDCDYWVSVRFDELGDRGIELLTQKCKGIEEWAQKRNIETHFFLMDINQTRENSFESRAEEESAGSALKLLLKDELFRTHILVAGKMPIWWLIPPGLSDEEYRSYVDTLNKSGNIRPDTFIDLGYLTDIPKAEIFGACLWQMNKALDSPFKSVIKFAYLELLLNKESKSLPLFSDKIKCLVTFPELLTEDGDGPLELADIDPYLLLSRDIASFYREEKTARQRENLIRECLFLKTIEGMESQKRRFGEDSQTNSTMNLMRKWHLLPDNAGHFSRFRFWKPATLIEEGAKVHDFLIATYKRLRSNFKSYQQQNALTITERDIAVLGRKLFTFYEKKEDKIEYIRSLSREIMAQNNVTFHVTRLDGEDYYHAFQGQYDHNTIKNNAEMLIKREKNLIRLVIWLYINGIIHQRTHLHLTKNYLSLSHSDIQDMFDAIRNSFPQIHFAHISPENLLKSEKITKALIVVNMGKFPVRGNKNLYSSIITRNSYGEYFIYHHETLIQLKNAIKTLLTKHYVSRWNNNLDIFIPEHPEKPIIQEMLEKSKKVN